MFIKLICPQMKLRPLDSRFKTNITPAMGLLILAGLTDSRHRVLVVDENTAPLNFDDYPDLVGITTNIDSAPRTYAIAATYRARGAKVVLGGIHASACPDEALRFADSVCIGEAELLWGQIVGDAEAGCLQPRYQNTQAVTPAAIGTPLWRAIEAKDYLFNNVVCASRGCPHQCEFCYNSCAYQPHCYRPRPISSVIAEIRRLNTRHIIFADDNLIGNIAWAKELMQALRALGISWNGAVSTLIVNHLDLLDDMRQAGCQSLFIGFETVRQSSLLNVSKFQNRTEYYQRLVHEIHQREIMINASFVFGFDHDTPDVFRSTLNWLVENRIETFSGHILTPYPGTKLYTRLQREERITRHDPELYNTARVVFEPAQMSMDQLQQGYEWLLRKFYSLPCIIKRLPQNKRQRLPYLAYNLGYIRFGRVLPAFLARAATIRRFGRLASWISYGIRGPRCRVIDQHERFLKLGAASARTKPFFTKAA